MHESVTPRNDFHHFFYFFGRLLALCLLLVSSSCVLGRQLTCRYDNNYGDLWPTYKYCEVSSVDLSERFKTVEHSFSGVSAEKSAATVVHFESPSQIDFLPKEISNDFPQLNGIMIKRCNTFTTIKEKFFGQDFKVIQYLDLGDNQIEKIEANAFQHLTKLKWIELSYNQLRSLPHQIFKNNPKLILIGFEWNEINSITPDFFKNLNKMQHVTFYSNQCISKDFGCTSGSCLISQSELDSGLSACFDNCLDDVKCTSPKPEVVQEEIVKSRECDARKFEEISQDLKTLQEDVKVQQKLVETINLFKENSTKFLEATKEEVKDLTKMLMLQFWRPRL
jgi:hypothetical protein